MFGHFDIKGTHEHVTGRNMNNIDPSDDNKWYLEGKNVVGNQVLDLPQQTGYSSLVLPSIMPSINLRALLRRKTWNFTTNKYSTEEVPLLQDELDQLICRVNFTLSSQE